MDVFKHIHYTDYCIMLVDVNTQRYRNIVSTLRNWYGLAFNKVYTDYYLQHGLFLHVELDESHSTVNIHRCDSRTVPICVPYYDVSDIPTILEDLKKAIAKKKTLDKENNASNTLQAIRDIFTQPNVQESCILTEETCKMFDNYLKSDKKDKQTLANVSDAVWKDISKCITDYLVNSFSDK